MSAWSEVFLGVIAFGALVMGVFYLALIVAGIRMMKRVNDVIDRAERAIQPTVQRIDAMADRAHMVLSRASHQVDRAERLFDGIEDGAHHVSSTLRTVASLPRRESAALAAGARAALKGFGERLFGTHTDGRPATHTDRIGARL